MTTPRLMLKPEDRNRRSVVAWLVPLLAGFAIGLAFALTLAWDIMTPLPVIGTISTLRAQDKERYIVLVSMSYALNSDLEGAKSRLRLLNDSDLQSTLGNLAERYTNELRPVAQRSSLAKLAMALGADSVTLRVYINTPTPTPRPPAGSSGGAVPVPTAIQPAATPARAPSLIAAPAPLDFRLLERTRLTCQQDPGPRPHIIIFVQDAAGNGLPGMRVRVQWGDGEDTFFTGLKGTDPGYADYEVQAGKSYSVSMVDATSLTALELSADALDETCPNDGKDHFRAWRVIFRRVG